MYIKYNKIPLSSFICIFLISSFVYVFIYFMGVGCRDIRHLSEWETPPTSHPPKNNFTKMGETLPVCREHVHAGRPLVEE